MPLELGAVSSWVKHMVIYWLGVLAKKNVASTKNMIINSYETNLEQGEVNMIGIITKHVRKEIKTRT